MYFDKIFSEHFRDVAVLTGMVAWLDNGNPLTIDNHKGVGESLKKDHGKQNLKRASFMLHYSANNAYKSLFSKSLSRYHADKFMKLMNVEYIALSDGKKGRQDIGCVERLAVRMFHQEKYDHTDARKSTPGKTSEGYSSHTGSEFHVLPYGGQR